MEYYVGATVISILIAWIVKRFLGFEKHKALKMFIVLLPLTIVSALRYNVGWDYEHYVEAYSGYVSYGDIYFDEIGFRGMIKFLANITEDPTILFATFSVLISLFFALCFKHYGKEKHVLQYILLFFMTRYFFCSLNIIRQALAMSMVIYAFHFILKERNKKNYLKFIIFVLLAASLHKFALVFIPLSFILWMDFKAMLTNIKAIFLIVTALVALTIYVVSSGYLAYFGTMFGNDGTMALSEFLICLIILVFGWIRYKELSKDTQNVLFYNFEIISLFVCLASPFIPTADRIIWYFATLPSVFLIPEIINSYGKKMFLVPAFMIYLFLGVVVFNQTIATDSYDIIPYRNVIEVNEMRSVTYE